MTFNKILSFLRIQSELDNIENIHASIIQSISFRGTNLWILVFAIVIASVGLNVNSTAVIIGAMLISPLMGPINGMGYSIATYDFPLFRRALKNFAFAVSASLTASTLYFAVTPLSTAHSELLARTSPSIYDVIIALIGGLAGIVAISSKHKGNVITGVAIATALMPPLCTAGYGLATAQFQYFFGAFYLFTINTVFIGLSSVLLSQFLKFPIRIAVGEKEKQKVHRWVTAIILITLVPSLYFGYLLVKKERFTLNANKLITAVSAIDGNYLLKYNIDPGNNSIALTYAGTNLRDSTKVAIREKANEFNLSGTELSFEQGFSMSEISHDITQVDQNLRAEISRLTIALRKDREDQAARGRQTIQTRRILDELRILYPHVTALSIGNTTKYGTRSASDSVNVSIVVISIARPYLRNAEKQKVRSWINQRLNSHSDIYYEQE